VMHAWHPLIAHLQIAPGTRAGPLLPGGDIR
jgi:hypothetical protein